MPCSFLSTELLNSPCLAFKSSSFCSDANWTYLSTSLIWHGQIETTEQKAKEVKSIVDSLISLAIKEKDNFETVEETVKIAKVDSNGNKVTEEATSKNGKKLIMNVRPIQD